ncbi:hypothetical protein KKH56_04960 [bacterium]|nr:hypothetical protein [bacterium]
MIVIDNNILSTLAKIEKIDILFEVFDPEEIAIVPGVYEELRNGLNRGYFLLSEVMNLVSQEKIKLLPLTEEEILLKSELPVSFDKGERECLVVCKLRRFKLVTNEKSVKNFCDREEIDYMDLPDLLRTLWRTELYSKDEVRELVREIEAKDNVVFKSPEEIFEKGRIKGSALET